MGKFKKALYVATVFSAGYLFCKYKEPTFEVVGGLYDKTAECIKQPVGRFYDWATRPSQLEQRLDSKNQ